MSFKQRHILILAAGMGTRMKSSLPKVLHSIAHQPLLGHVLTCALQLNETTCHVVIPHQSPCITAYLNNYFKDVNIIIQPQAKGTGHAMQCALPHLPSSGYVVVLFGDTPLIKSTTIESVFTQLEAGSTAVVVGMQPIDPTGYGRLITNTACDQVTAIVEHKEANPDERAITLCNSGIMGFNLNILRKFISELPLSDLAQEYYLTDLIKIMNDNQLSCHLQVADSIEVCGVNNRADLAHLEHIYQQQQRQKIMLSGVTLLDPSSVYFAYDTVIHPDVIIEPQVFFGPHVTVNSGSTIKAFSHIDGATINNNVQVGPFARLRPGTVLKNDTKVGNFVEIKKSTLGQGSKVNHLSYIGDTTVGINSNIGAGTITCNYDGQQKFKTIIGDHVFVGSNTALIAPLTIGNNALIAAGSTITKSVAAGDLAIARPITKLIKQGGKRFQARHDPQIKDIK